MREWRTSHSRRDRGIALAFGVVLSSLAPACLDRFEQAQLDGAQEQLRDFKDSAKDKLADIDSKLRGLGSLTRERDDSSTMDTDIAALVARRNDVAQRVDALSIDGRSRWDQTQADLESQLTELVRDVTAAAEAAKRPDSRR
jgi:hypothetical protein